MAKKIIIYTDKRVRNITDTISKEIDSFQNDFAFYSLPELPNLETIVNSENIDFEEKRRLIFDFKISLGYKENDLLIVIGYFNLSYISEGANKLFSAGSSVFEEDPGVSFISLSYLHGEILNEKYSYEIQLHSITYLILGVLICTYVDIQPHRVTFGCILDFDNNLIDFNQKIQNGYLLCNHNQKNCHNIIGASDIGKSILAMCDKLRTTTFCKNFPYTFDINDARSAILLTNIDSLDTFHHFIITYNLAVKKPIESWGFHRFLWNKDTPVNEPVAQVALNALFKIVIELKNINISKEVETGNKFLDFLCTYNTPTSMFKVAIEIKNAHNGNISDSFHQMKQYLDAESTRHGVLVVLWYKSEKFNKPTEYSSKEDLLRLLKKEIPADYNIKIIIIDCSEKTAPSKLKQ